MTTILLQYNRAYVRADQAKVVRAALVEWGYLVILAPTDDSDSPSYKIIELPSA